MFHRFAAASAVASVVVAGGASVSLLTRWPAASARVVTTAWCFIPAAWGLWAMLAPASWVPRRLPQWGAILGLLAGIMAGPVLDLPLRLAEVRGVGWVPIVVGPVLYFVLWLLVRLTYISLRVLGQPAYAASKSGRS